MCIGQVSTQAKGFTQFSIMSPTYRGSGLSFGSIGSLDDIIESFRLHAAGGGKDLYGTTKHKRVQPLLRSVVYGQEWQSYLLSIFFIWEVSMI